ncbi:site-specific integrase [Tsuneonella sp. YG55]|uniref:Site-specific integrase n=1 Tax=Tsuneonella litorea TaxID=2976475 RepID=A0A9X2W1R9_9SPHN|nr:site-specific integrase [Tsuneonella litorea]MCT2559373.1 site-specific integrase [Tsuneonella litorea]
MFGPSASRCHLDAILARCDGAYSPTTLRGYRNDLLVFMRWCARSGRNWLPASPAAVARFIDEEARSISIATIRRRVCAIQFAHRISDLPSPVRHSDVYLALRRATRAKRRRPRQALGLTAGMLERIAAACPDTLSGARDAALFSVGYDTLCRSAELAAMRVEHVSADLGSLVVPRSKSDPFGDGRVAYLSAASAARLRRWLDLAGIAWGPLFRGLHTGAVSPTALDTSSIRRRIKVVARRAGLSAEQVRHLSGHSMRVGAAQDMLVAGVDTLGIMQAGGWRSHAVLARYVENAVVSAMHHRRWSRLQSQRECSGCHRPGMACV